VAVAFAKEGADVCIVYLEEHGDAAKVKQAVEGAGRRCLALAGDVGQENFCREVVERSVGKALGTGNKEEDEKGAPDRKPQPREVEVFCPVASI
jgi:NAD(P)-dependent dehydrogenase (short-subunit alcohol dehydrogenase family)